MKIENRKGVFLKVGEYVKIINHKFPELHPKNVTTRSSSKTPDEMEKIQLKCNSQNEPVVHFRKNALFEYKLSGLNYIGMEGVIIKIRNKAECEYEKDTGDIARYVVKIKSNLLNWKNKIVTLYPSQVQKIHKITYKEIEKQKEKRKRRESKQLEKAINELFAKIHLQHE